MTATNTTASETVAQLAESYPNLSLVAVHTTTGEVVHAPDNPDLPWTAPTDGAIPDGCVIVDLGEARTGPSYSPTAASRAVEQGLERRARYQAEIERIWDLVRAERSLFGDHYLSGSPPSTLAEHEMLAVMAEGVGVSTTRDTLDTARRLRAALERTYADKISGPMDGS